MKIAELLLPEFDQEMASTRKVLERIPNDKLDWKVDAEVAHDRLGRLAPGRDSQLGRRHADERFVGHRIRRAASRIARRCSTSNEEMLAKFDTACGGRSRGDRRRPRTRSFLKPWSLLTEGKPMFTMPRYTVVRSFVINHTIHHRAFLLSYLRLNDVPVPGMYGPSGGRTRTSNDDAGRTKAARSRPPRRRSRRQAPRGR